MDKPARPTGLGFFGAVIASISHEIKNRIAIINEQTLLIRDLAQVSVNGRELNPAQVVGLTDSVKAEIDTADTIIKTMNKFAHSVDNLKKPVDIGNVIDLTATLFKRMADMRSAKLEVCPPPKPIVINTVAFLLMNLTWLCMNAALEKIGKNRTIRLGCEKTPEGAAVWLTVDSVETDMTDAFSHEEMTDLANGLGAEVSFLPEKNTVRILLPADTDWL